MREFPEKFKKRMMNLLGEDFQNFERCVLMEKNVKGLRVNTKKISVSNFLKINPYNLKKLPYNADGFIFNDENIQMGGEVYHQAGMFYMQEPSAMIPVNSVKIKKNWKVLDLCAAPGGKTSQISNALANEGFVIANDIKFDRCKALVFNIERLGLDNVIITSSNSESLCKNFSNYFDMVLIDATCSGEGMFRKNPNFIETWSQKNIERCCDIQQMLLLTAAKTLKKDGLLVYSTCTFSLEENEQMIAQFLSAHPFELVEVDPKIVQNTAPGYAMNNEYEFSKMRRFYPHLHPGEGQFVAVLRKIISDGEEFCNCAQNKKCEIPNEVLAFLNSVGVSMDKDRLFIKSNKIWIIPKSHVILKNNVVSYGVKLGEIKNDSFVPDHAFFMAFGLEFNNIINFNGDEQKLKLYLEGKSFNWSCKNGYGVIQVNGCTLGGFYAKNNYVNSLYPKNLTNKDIFIKNE